MHLTESIRYLPLPAVAKSYFCAASVVTTDGELKLLTLNSMIYDLIYRVPQLLNDLLLLPRF